MKKLIASLLLLSLVCCGLVRAEVDNIKVITDASPDYSDMPSLVHSVTSKWPAVKDKVWAMFYWTHLGKRQTTPQIVHGFECADPIRQFNDYGFAMCSTVSGVNCAIWHHMGLKVKFWDISNHTVSECFYDDKWHVYDNAFSAFYTLCDGKTVASVLDVAAEGSCALSGGRVEKGHVARYHCQTCTSINGFITGSDCDRSLASMQGDFTGHQYRYYLCNWDDGHRYILNLKDGDVYTRYYHSLGGEPKYYIPNYGEHPEKPPIDTETAQKFKIRGNGRWTFTPPLNTDYKKNIYSEKSIAAAAPVGLKPETAGTPGEVIFKIQSANVTTSMTIDAKFDRKTPDDVTQLSISTDNGLHWKEIWTCKDPGEQTAKVNLIADVNGAYETLIKATLMGKSAADNAMLKELSVETITEINAKANPKLNLGKNTVYVATGDQTESIVYWPDNEGDKYKQFLCEEKNIVCGFDPGWIYYGRLYPKDTKQDAYVVYKIEAPSDITKLTYGGRFSNRYDGHHIDMLYSLDDGKTWTTSWSLKSAEQPWDTLHAETVEIPAGHRSVKCKYLMSGGSSIYSNYMEASYKPADTTFKPFEVTYTWNEVQPDRKTVQRSHTQLVEKVPFTYTINVGGADHPVMESLRVNLKGSVKDAKYGYSDDKDAGGEKYMHRWVTYGKNFAEGKPYTISGPSKGNQARKDTILTDGVAGPPMAGGVSPSYGVEFDEGKTPEITVDLGKVETCGAFRMFITAGWPWWDAMNGEVQDKIEVLTSEDGKDYKSQGFLNTNIYKKDLPINFMAQDSEKALGYNFELIAPAPVKAQYVRWKLTSKRWLSVTEVQAFDFIKYEPFDIKLALPNEK